MTIPTGVHISLNELDIIKSKLPSISACQVFLTTPLSTKPVTYDVKKTKQLIKELGIKVIVHSSYVTSPWGIKPYNIPLCLDQLQRAYEIGAEGVIFHVAKLHPKKLAPGLKKLISKKHKSIKIYLEHRALKPDPDSTFETPEKMNYLVKTLVNEGIALKDINFCIDTAHLFSSGVVLTKFSDTQTWIDGLEHPNLIKCIHLNGSKSSNFKDQHAVAFSKADKIWHGINPKLSGFNAFVKLANKNKAMIIMENPISTIHNQLMDFIKVENF